MDCGILIWIHNFHFSSFKGREIGDEKLVGILDLKDISYKNVDARALITGFQFLQVNHFDCLILENHLDYLWRGII